MIKIYTITAEVEDKVVRVTAELGPGVRDTHEFILDASQSPELEASVRSVASVVEDLVRQRVRGWAKT